MVITLTLIEGTDKKGVPRSVGVCRFVEVGDGASDAHTHSLPVAGGGAGSHVSHNGHHDHVGVG